jgi:predicted unusual protein kinase regulating ubiquinone biosynthesis (AarF/ABC1/UbiB family)
MNHFSFLNKKNYYWNGVFFLFQVLYIFAKESFFYFFFTQNYKTYIYSITTQLAKINILCVKIFQSLALNNKLFDSEINNHLLIFTDHSPYSIKDIDFKIIDHLIMDENIIVDESNLLPIKSGMISLVYKGFYKNKPIIIKIKRKNILQKLNLSLYNIFFLIDFLSIFPYFSQFINEYKINSLIQKNIEIIKEQIDFKKEVENTIKMKQNCNSLNYIKIPHVYPNITDKYPDIILMEFIDGQTIQEIEKEDYDIYAKLLLKFGFVTSMIHGFAHGDLHAGNILFIKEPLESSTDLILDKVFKYKLGILDFGIMYQINESFKNIILEITCDLFQTPIEVSAKKILESGLILQPLSVIQKISESEKLPLLNIIIFTLNECLDKNKDITQIQIYKFINNLYHQFKELSISSLELYLSDDFIKTQLVIAMVHGITMKLCKDNYIDLADKIIKELFHTDLLLDVEE